MSQLHNSNKLQLPLNQKMSINSLTSSALRNPLNNSPPHSGLWTSNNNRHHLQLTLCSGEWRLTIAQSTSTIISLLSLNQISNNRPSNRQHLVLWIALLNQPQRQLHKHLHRKICLVAWICLLGNHNSHNNKFSNSNHLSLQLNPRQCGTMAHQINCLILAVQVWWVMKKLNSRSNNCLL